MLEIIKSFFSPVGGGQLRSNNYSASSRSIKGGEGNYTSLMSSDFAGTETMLNPDHRVGGVEIHLDSSIQRKGASHYLDLPLIHEMISLSRREGMAA